MGSKLLFCEDCGNEVKNDSLLISKAKVLSKRQSKLTSNITKAVKDKASIISAIYDSKILSDFFVLKSGLKLGEQKNLLCIGCHIIVTVKRTLQVKIVLVCFSRGRSPEQSPSSFSTSCVCTHCWLLSPSAASASSLVFVGRFLARWGIELSWQKECTDWGVRLGACTVQILIVENRQSVLPGHWFEWNWSTGSWEEICAVAVRGWEALKLLILTDRVCLCSSACSSSCCLWC